MEGTVMRSSGAEGILNNFVSLLVRNRLPLSVNFREMRLQRRKNLFPALG